MKSATLLCIAVLLGYGTAIAAETDTRTPQPLKVGATITTKNATNIDRLAKDPKRYVGRTLRIEGVVKGVCQGRGCWVEVASATGQSFLAKSLDESVLLPKDCVGRRIVVQGKVTTLPAPGAEAHQHAEHNTDGHACPAPSYVLSTHGVELASTAKD